MTKNVANISGVTPSAPPWQICGYRPAAHSIKTENMTLTKTLSQKMKLKVNPRSYQWNGGGSTC